MATDAFPGTEKAVDEARPSSGLFSGRRGRILRENLTAYLFLLPGGLIIFIFGIFPVFYAAYVSMFKWRIKQGEFRGLDNFVGAMGSVAYVFFFALAFFLIVVAITTAMRAFRVSNDKQIPIYFPLASLIPGALLTSGMVLFILRCITFFTQEEAIEAGDASILGSIWGGLALILLGVGVNVAINRWQHSVAAETQYSILPSFVGPATTFIFTAGLGGLLAWFTWSELRGLRIEDSSAYVRATYAIPMMIGGIGLFAVAYALWRWSMSQQGALKTLLGLFAAGMAIGGAIFFSIYWPFIQEGSDADFYQSLLVTVFFSAGTVPLQLAIAVSLAYLLFQDIKFKGLFRVLYFVPYMAPSVAAAGIFQVIFSSRESSMANQLFGWLTGLFGEPNTLSWLREPASFVSAIGEAVGIEALAAVEGGPSLALVVIILYSIWVYVGYNTVIFLAGLGNIPNSLYEAAEIDGAGRWALFRHITLPLLSPITFFLSVLAVIGTFKAFNSIWVLRTTAALGTTDTASVLFFEEFFRGARFGYATSMAIVLFIIILALTLLQNRLAEGRVHYG